MERLKIEGFISSGVNEEYSKKQFVKYRGLSDIQLQKIEDLIPHIGKEVLYILGKNKIKMILAHIPRKLVEKCKDGIYSSYPFNIRLNYAEPPKRGTREWNGFWTWNIDKIITNF